MLREYTSEWISVVDRGQKYKVLGPNVVEKTFNLGKKKDKETLLNTVTFRK